MHTGEQGNACVLLLISWMSCKWLVQVFLFDVIRIMFFRLTSLAVLDKYKKIKILQKMCSCEARYFFSFLTQKISVKDLLVNSPVFSVLCLLSHALLN